MGPINVTSSLHHHYTTHSRIKPCKVCNCLEETKVMRLAKTEKQINHLLIPCLAVETDEGSQAEAEFQFQTQKKNTALI